MRAASGPVAWSATTAGTASRCGRRAAGRPCHAGHRGRAEHAQPRDGDQGDGEHAGGRPSPDGRRAREPVKAEQRREQQAQRPQVQTRAGPGGDLGAAAGAAVGAARTRCGASRPRARPVRPSTASAVIAPDARSRRSIATRPASSTGTDSSSDPGGRAVGVQQGQLPGGRRRCRRGPRGPGPVSRTRQSSRTEVSQGPSRSAGHDGEDQRRAPAAHLGRGPAGPAPPATASTSSGRAERAEDGDREGGGHGAGGAGPAASRPGRNRRGPGAAAGGPRRHRDVRRRRRRSASPGCPTPGRPTPGASGRW